MNKVLKGLVAVAATAAMAVAGFAGASSAMAVEGHGDYDGAILVDTGDAHTYSIYQIFTGTYGGDGSLGDVKAGNNFKEENGAGSQGENLSAAEAAAEVAKLDKSAPDSDKLATINKFVDLTKGAYGEVSEDTPLSEVPAGYYLAKDKDAVTGDDAATLYIVKVVGNDEVTIYRKADKPTFEKKVQDVNDTKGTTTDWQDSADYDVNDKVPFKLTATLPTDSDDFAAYKTYKLVFHDTQSAGLTFNEDIKVTYADKTVSPEYYKVETTGLTDGETFRVTINDVKSVKDAEGNSINVVAGGIFNVEYTSTLNDKSVIGSKGNPNEAYLDYSNNPNVTGEGAPTGETPKDKVIVFTYQLNVNKTFDQGSPAENDLPKFKLYKAYKHGDNTTWTQVGNEVTVTKTEDGKYTASFPRIDDGNYKLVETHTPAGYNTAADTEFTVTADHDVESNNPQLISLKFNETAGDTNAGTVQANVVNKKGSNLPSTGGMGTVLLYVAGIAVFVLAGATLVMALRRRNA